LQRGLPDGGGRLPNAARHHGVVSDRLYSIEIASLNLALMADVPLLELE